MSKPYMVQQVIKFSDGTETIINYKKEQGMEENEIVEAPVVEESAPEVIEEVVAEAPAESVEESA